MSHYTFGHLYSSGLDRELGTDDSTQLFTTQRRQDAILEGEQQFVDLTECLIRQSSITCSNGVREYDLLANSTDFMRVAAQGPEYRLVSSGSSGSTRRTAGNDFRRKDIERLNREQPGWRDSTGSALPQSWYLRADGGSLYFGFSEPTNIGSSETGTLTVPYVANPAESTESTRRMFSVSGSERIDLRPYHDAVVHYGAYQLEKLRKDRQASDLQLQKFIGYVTRYRSQSGERTGHQAVSAQHEYFRAARRGGGRYSGDPRVDD